MKLTNTLLAVSLIACSTLEGLPRADVVLFRGHLESLETAPAERPYDDGEDTIEIGGNVLADIAVAEVLIGASERRVRVTLRMTSLPRARPYRDVFVLAQVSAGQFDVVQWDYVANGLCISREAAKDLQIEQELSSVVDRLGCNR